MFSSVKMLRKSVITVNSYIQLGSYYVDTCQKPANSEDWHVNYESVLKIKLDSANSLLTKASECEEEIKHLMAKIESIEKSFYFQRIYKSPNWSHAYTLLKSFLTNVIYPHKAIANRCKMECGGNES